LYCINQESKNITIDEVGDFKPQVISDIQERGFDVIDVNGIFDLYVEKNKGHFIELKVANKHYKPWASKRGLKGINLTSQTQAIRSMENLPIIFACDEDNMDICYLILPDELKLLADEREKHEAILIGTKNLKRKPYNVALNKLIEYLK
jgi:hypothetical protein